MPATAPPLFPATNAPVLLPASGWVSLDAWAQTNGLGRLRLSMENGNPTGRLATTNGLLQIAAGHRVARWDGLEVGLGFAPRYRDGLLQVHVLDLQKSLAPLVRPRAFGQVGRRVVVLDPGHGGADPGTTNPKYHLYEKDLTLDWARRLKPLLEARGWTVHLTRVGDVSVARSNRVAVAEQAGAELFLSLHFNAHSRPEASGLETYTLTPIGMPSNFNRSFADDPARAFPNNAYDEQNLQYAVRVHRSLAGFTNSADRGVRRARFLEVLQGQNCPAILIEGGYLSNPAEARKLATADYRQRLAEAVARAIP
jgi:N-acetylmuramoyl-L-alanine amidase